MDLWVVPWTGVKRFAFHFSPADDAASGKRARVLGHNGVLAFGLLVIVEIDDDPIVGALELVSARGVREQCGEMPSGAVRMHDRQPLLPCRIESTRSDFSQ